MFIGLALSCSFFKCLLYSFCFFFLLCSSWGDVFWPIFKLPMLSFTFESTTGCPSEAFFFSWSCFVFPAFALDLILINFPCILGKNVIMLLLDVVFYARRLHLLYLPHLLEKGVLRSPTKTENLFVHTWNYVITCTHSYDWDLSAVGHHSEIILNLLCILCLKVNIF